MSCLYSYRQYEESGGDLNSLRNASELSFGTDSCTSYSLDVDVVLQLYTKNTGTEVRANLSLCQRIDGQWCCGKCNSAVASCLALSLQNMEPPAEWRSTDACCACCLLLCMQGVLVKVYALNCWKLYTSTQDEPDLNLELAGVAPTHTITLSTPADPMVRSVTCLYSITCLSEV